MLPAAAGSSGATAAPVVVVAGRIMALRTEMAWASDASPAGSEEDQRAIEGVPLADAEATAVALSRDAGEPAVAE